VVDLNTYYDWFNVMYYFGVSAIDPLIYGALDKKLFSSFQQCGRNTKSAFLKILDKWDKTIDISELYKQGAIDTL
jgi:hypothetical protein